MSKTKETTIDKINDEERYFSYWLDELIEAGYVTKKYEQKSYVLTDEVKATRSWETKKGVKSEEFTLIPEHSYTPDFEFVFSNRAKNLFYHDTYGGYEYRPFFYCRNYFDNINNNSICIDIKGAFVQQFNSAITFPDRQAMLWQRHQIYVQKVIPFDLSGKKKTLFSLTFTPKKVIEELVYKTDKPGKWKKGDSKIKWKVKTLEEYVREHITTTTMD
jgi:hypothetical protein